MGYRETLAAPCGCVFECASVHNTDSEAMLVTPCTPNCPTPRLVVLAVVLSGRPVEEFSDGDADELSARFQLATEAKN